MNLDKDNIIVDDETEKGVVAESSDDIISDTTEPTEVVSSDSKGGKKKKVKMKKVNRCNIGGQAVLEGVMMLGAKSMATAVRDETGRIQVESKRTKPLKKKSVLRRIPFVRGALNFASTMYMGVKVLLRSTAVFDGETEPTKFEKWCAKKLHVDAMSILMGFSVLLGVALAIGLFFVIPHFISMGLEKWWGDSVHPIVYNLVEGVIRIIIFVAYVYLASLMKEIKRTFMYHGAEHKTINCYEYGLPLTVENVRKQSTIHDRCGTTFMVIVMVISILVFSFTGFIPNLNIFLELLIKLALLPVVAGISYEILKFLAKFDNKFVKVVKAPGLLLQKVTTKQPTDDMIEVAITSFNTVLEMDNDETIAEQSFDIKVLYKDIRAEMDQILENIGDGNADADWIAVDVLGVKRSELAELSHIKSHNADKMIELAKERAEGKPLQQVLGNTDFYGLPIKVDGRVLCPRPETEYLVEAVVDIIGENGINKVLDLCTGSGAIAIIIKKKCDNVIVTASDISADALELAKENAALNDTEIEFVLSDYFANVQGKFGLIVSNPPYIKSNDIDGLDKEVKDYEPRIALDGGESGLDAYVSIILSAKDYLDNGGYIAFEVGIGQAEDVKKLLEDNRYTDIIIKQDLENIDRIVIARSA